jgi:response regulator of citrate/malate metabolism
MLFIEDDKIDQLAFKRLVKEENLPYRYRIAGSVSEAKMILANHKFDIIIIDHFLGDGTAFDLIDQANDTPIIFVTGVSDKEIGAKAIEAGACDFFIKDPEMTHLKTISKFVNNILKQKQRLLPSEKK